MVFLPSVNMLISFAHHLLYNASINLLIILKMMNVVCRNLNLGLATKAKRVSRVQAKKSVRMKIHTPK
jgi:hypothetical protein